MTDICNSPRERGRVLNTTGGSVSVLYTKLVRYRALYAIDAPVFCSTFAFLVIHSSTLFPVDLTFFFLAH